RFSHGAPPAKRVHRSYWPVRLDLAIGEPTLRSGAYSQECEPMPRDLGISPPSRGIVLIERTLGPPPTGRVISRCENVVTQYVRRMKSVETRGATTGDPSPSPALVHR